MIDIQDDPFDGLAEFSRIIEQYQSSVKRSAKDRSVVLSERPSVFYVNNQEVFTGALQYYNYLLNKQCPGDCDMGLSNRIREKRSKYMVELRKLITVAYE